jgi:hypothetical protein
MKKYTLFCLTILIITICGCVQSGISLETLEGVWVMDSGDETYLNEAGFEIKKTDNNHSIYLGMMKDGKFNSEEGPIVLSVSGKSAIAQIEKNMILKLTPDKTGINVEGMSEKDKKIDYHFKKADK